MACHSQRFFAEAEAEGESPVGWHQTGSLGLARSAEHWEQLQRGVELLKDAGVPHEVYHVLSDPADAAAVRAIHPLLDLAGVHGAIYTPTDGIVNPVDSCMAVVRAARRAGARFVEQCGVAQLNTAALEISGGGGGGGVSVSGSGGGSGGGIDAVRDVATVHAVTTTNGERVACGAVLLACGSWTRQLAAQLGVVVPTAIVPHQYAVFDCVAGVSNKLPVVREYVRSLIATYWCFLVLLLTRHSSASMCSCFPLTPLLLAANQLPEEDLHQARGGRARRGRL
jgi:glycine/D-amino acid oxidase-like deaminating enzyme